MVRLWAVGFVCAISALAGAVHAETQPIGQTVAASDTVQGRGAVRSKKLVSADPVYLNDRILSNATGLGQFKFDDGTKLVVSSGANIVLNQYVYTGRSLKKFTLTATKGAFRWISGSGPSNAYKVITPAGTLGVRGTVFDFTVRGQRTYLALLRGEVEFCGRSGRCETLRRPCDFIIADATGVSDPEALRSSAGSVASAFPLLRNQRGLKGDFRVGNSCITKQARLTDPTVRTQQNTSVNPGPNPGPGPSPSPATGNPGNTKSVGQAGENPGKGGFGNQTKGKSDTRG